MYESCWGGKRPFRNDRKVNFPLLLTMLLTSMINLFLEIKLELAVYIGFLFVLQVIREAPTRREKEDLPLNIAALSTASDTVSQRHAT